MIKKLYWEDNWDYNPNLSYRIGNDLNSTRPPFDRAKIIIFYPDPFNEKTPHWGKHFIAYVRGATDAAKLDDLGYKY
jgi:hypothetical protein